MKNIGHFIARRLMQHNRRSFTRVIIRIAMSAIAVSVAVMILTSAVISGFKKEITEKIFGFWGHIHITDSNVSRNFEVVPIPGNAPFYDSIRSIESLQFSTPVEVFGRPVGNYVHETATHGGVKSVTPYILFPGLLSHTSLFHGVLLKGVDSTYHWPAMQSFLTEGKTVSFLGDSLAAEIMVSRHIADKMKLKTGSKVILNFIVEGRQLKRRFSVCGIYKTGLEEYDKRLCMIDIRILQRLLGWEKGEVQGMEIVLDDVRDLDVYTDYIYTEVLPPQYYAESIRQKFPSIFDWLNLQDINEEIILGLMILVAIINMVTVLLILILERTQMIGILASLGMTHTGIRKIFLYHAAYIIFYGLLAGNCLGLGLAFLQQSTGFIQLDEANYYLKTAPVLIEWPSLLWINAGTFLITLLALILPTYLVTRITPVRALRFS